jgi:NitT/TauT family transport system substrate-binding protein
MRNFTGIVATAFVGAAVGSLSMSVPALAQDKMTATFMSSNHQSCSPFPQMVAQELGFWEDQGLEVTLLNTQTSVPYVAFLQNGDADIAMLDSSQVLQAADAGLPIKVVYEAYQFAPENIVVPADSPIQSLERYDRRHGQRSRPDHHGHRARLDRRDIGNHERHDRRCRRFWPGYG